jgi:hypothetical protein
MAKQIEEALPVLAEDISIVDPLAPAKDLRELYSFINSGFGIPAPNIQLMRDNLHKIEEIIDAMIAVAPAYAKTPRMMTLKICLWETQKELALVSHRDTTFLINSLKTLNTLDALKIVPDTLIDVTPLSAEDQIRMSLREREHKEEAPKLAKSEEVDLSSLSLIPAMGVEETGMGLLGSHDSDDLADPSI